MMDGYGGWIIGVVSVVFVALLAIGLIYGSLRSRRQQRDRALDPARERATRELYERQAEEERRRA